MSYRQVYRSTTSRVLGAAVIGFCVLGFGSLALAGSLAALLRLTPALVLLGVVAWLAYWRPRVVLDEHGVTLHNVFRRIEVPWVAVVEVQSRYGLRVDTAYGSFDAWAVPAPTGRDRASGAETTASIMVRQRLERLRALEELESPSGRTAPQVRLHAGTIGAVSLLAALAAAAVIVPLG